MTSTMADTIVYTVDGNVARITLDDGKVNAMSLPFFEALGAALDRAEREKPGAVVITGRPGYFSAGLDLKLMPTLAPDRLLDEASSAAARLGALHQAAYAASKTRLRAMAVEWALARLEPEVMNRPSGS